MYIRTNITYLYVYIVLCFCCCRYFVQYILYAYSIELGVCIVYCSICVPVQATVVLLVMAMVSVFRHKTEDAAADADQELTTRRRELTGWDVLMSIALQQCLLVIVTRCTHWVDIWECAVLTCVRMCYVPIFCMSLCATNILSNVYMYCSTVL